MSGITNNQGDELAAADRAALEYVANQEDAHPGHSIEGAEVAALSVVDSLEARGLLRRTNDTLPRMVATTAAGRAAIGRERIADPETVPAAVPVPTPVEVREHQPYMMGQGRRATHTAQVFPSRAEAEAWVARAGRPREGYTYTLHTVETGAPGEWYRPAPGTYRRSFYSGAEARDTYGSLEVTVPDDGHPNTTRASARRFARSVWGPDADVHATLERTTVRPGPLESPDPAVPATRYSIVIAGPMGTAWRLAAGTLYPFRPLPSYFDVPATAVAAGDFLRVTSGNGETWHRVVGVGLSHRPHIRTASGLSFDLAADDVVRVAR